MIADLIALLFLARELTHRAHLKASSYGHHVALGEFYDAIVDHADAIAEAWQGQNGALLDIPLLDGDTSAPIAGVLREHLEWIAEHRAEICPPDQTAISNLIDEAVSAYQSTLYKLEFLK